MLAGTPRQASLSVAMPRPYITRPNSARSLWSQRTLDTDPKILHVSKAQCLPSPTGTALGGSSVQLSSRWRCDRHLGQTFGHSTAPSPNPRCVTASGWVHEWSRGAKYDFVRGTRHTTACSFHPRHGQMDERQTLLSGELRTGLPCRRTELACWCCM